MKRLAIAALGFLVTACAAQTSESPSSRWTNFVKVDGQPEPVPAEWVATPEGRFAHSIKIPNPLPADSGYRAGMTSEQYFDHLCKTEAGEFIYRTAESVDGFFFMRPPRSPSDEDLMSRYKLEDPYTERFYQLRGDSFRRRAAQFVNPPFNNYRYVEEPRREVKWQESITEQFIRMSGYVFNAKTGKASSEMSMVGTITLRSRFGYTWRGIRRFNDRENGLAGSELLIVDLSSREVMAVLRNYAYTANARRTPEGVWWLNAATCRQFPVSYQDNLGKQIYEFVAKVLKPVPISER